MAGIDYTTIIRQVPDDYLVPVRKHKILGISGL